MTMRETEQSILDDLALLGDGLNRMEYLLGCAKAYPGIPPEERTDAALVRDCQMKTWFDARWEGETLRFRADSESVLVKGALALLAELYDARSRDEVSNYTCGLLNEERFAALFNADQKKGLRSILRSLAE